MPTSKLAPEMSRPILSFLQGLYQGVFFLLVLLFPDMEWVWSSPEAQKEHGESGLRYSALILMIRARNVNEYDIMDLAQEDYESD